MSEWIDSAFMQAINHLVESGNHNAACDLSRVFDASDFSATEIFRDSCVEDLALEFSKVKSFAELRKTQYKLARALKLQHCSTQLVNERKCRMFPINWVTTYQEEWINKYINNNYKYIDPIIKASNELSNNFNWSDLRHDEIELSKFSADALLHGIGPSGYTILTESEAGDKFSISVSSTDRDDAFKRKLERCLPDLELIAPYIIDAFTYVSVGDDNIEINPSDEMINVLRAIGEGESIMRLSSSNYRFGSFDTLSKSICTMFGASSLNQAAVLAARMGLLDDVVLSVRSVQCDSSERCSNISYAVREKKKQLFDRE